MCTSHLGGCCSALRSFGLDSHTRLGHGHISRHFLYYSCAWVPLLFAAHPIHFLYVKFHADIAPIGGHDGYDEPSANGSFHWLHHAYYECNYGGAYPSIAQKNIAWPYNAHIHTYIALPDVLFMGHAVPFPIDFDKMFGTLVDYAEYKERGSIRGLLKGAAA